MGQKQDTNINLAVKANVNVSTISQANVKNMIDFTDDMLGDPQDPANPTTWISKVDKSKKVKWTGTSDPSRNIIFKITGVDREPNFPVQILKKDSYSDKNNDGIVVGQVKDVDVTGGEHYKVSFTINGTPLYIDPVLQMRPA